LLGFALCGKAFFWKRASVKDSFSCGGQVNSDLALTLFNQADFIANKTDQSYANEMYDEPSAVKKLKGPGEGH